MSLVKEAEEERKRYTRKNILHVEEKKQPTPRMTCRYDLYGNKVCKPAPPQPCPTLSDQIVGLIRPVTNTVDVAVRNFFSWVDKCLDNVAQWAGFIALGAGFIALTAATMGLFPACAGWTIAGISVSTIATSTAPVAIVSGTIGMGGSITQIASGTMGYRLDGTKLTEEEAKKRILEGQFNASISSTGVSFGALAGAITYVSGELKNANGEQQNNDFGNKISADDIKYSDKFSKGAYVNQVTERGWSNQKIADTINNPYKVVDSVNTFTGNPAKAYFINEIHYVVIDTITNKVVQVSDLADDFWKFTPGNFSK